MKISIYPEKSTWNDLLKRPVLEVSKLEDTVREVLEAIKQEGDEAVSRYTRQFDQVDLKHLDVSRNECIAVEAQLSETLKNAIQTAKQNIEKFHTQQKTTIERIETMPGVNCWRKSVGIEKVGLYIPGGTAPLFSTVLMLAVPAKLAGCKEIVLCSPPGKDGNIHPAILYTAMLAGVSRIYKIGGVQAIGAMAYGTESVPAVYKIFGPGNQYVTAAKQVVSREGIAIDMPAGPSEVLVLADYSANPAYVAADLLSQAEHGADSQVVLVAYKEEKVKAILKEVETQLEALPRKEFAAESLKNSVAIVVKNEEEAIDLINAYAPEHLILSVNNPEIVAEQITNAGSVFLGHYTPESVGDYASGTNHTLPTNGFAKAYSGVSLDSFVKKITFQQLTKEGLQNIGPVVEAMAEAEELIAHKNAVSIRLKS
jgi:histidinol dehydrogenase